jgi:hypothetical protein
MTWLIFTIAVAVLTVGVWLLRTGRRGRAIDDHPICRKCGFDLFGLTAPSKCPECGTELSPKVIRIGHRAARRWPVGFGVFLIIPALALLVVMGVRTARTFDPQRYKPVWFLLREANATNVTDRSDAAALVELNRRLAAGQMSVGSIDRVVQSALAVQANLKRPWLATWGDFVERARRGNKVPDDAWKRYARQSLPALTMTAREKVRRGDPLPVFFQGNSFRLGNSKALSVVVDWRGAWIDQLPLPTHKNARNLIVIPQPLLPKLTDGPHTLRGDIDVTVYDMTRPPKSVADMTVALVTPRVSTTFELVPQNQRTVELVKDPSLRAGVEAAVSLTRSNISVGAAAAFGIRVSPPPIALAYDAVVIDPAGREWPTGSNPVVCASGQSSYWTFMGMWEGFDADRVDIVLRPNPEAAEKTIAIKSIWGGEIRFRDVTVTWAKDARRPTSFATTRPATTRAAR